MHTSGSWPMNELYAVAAIAERDLMKFLRDRSRLIGTFVLPFLLMGLLGGTLQLNLGRATGFNFIGFTFTGVLGMTIFQSTAAGMAWLAEDRFNDFAQEMFVSPVSRYSIVFGKILGESLVALAQAAPLVLFAIVLRVSLSPEQIALMLPVAVISCLLERSARGQPDLSVPDPAAVFPGGGLQPDRHPAVVLGNPVADLPHAVRG
ncbi:MAG: ABC transporter permease [Chloroflexi bacterium]|nr:MAG: ABC transporter permease [Chloroflexota bacterium]